MSFQKGHAPMGGRPASEDYVLARELGISKRRVQTLGGAARLRAMSADALATLIAPHSRGDSRALDKGGLSVRGFQSRTRGLETSASFLIRRTSTREPSICC